jgi:hypothetical protein
MKMTYNVMKKVTMLTGHNSYKGMPAAYCTTLEWNTGNQKYFTSPPIAQIRSEVSASV